MLFWCQKSQKKGVLYFPSRQICIFFEREKVADCPLRRVTSSMIFLTKSLELNITNHEYNPEEKKQKQNIPAIQEPNPNGARNRISKYFNDLVRSIWGSPWCLPVLNRFPPCPALLSLWFLRILKKFQVFRYPGLYNVFSRGNSYRLKFAEWHDISLVVTGDKWEVTTRK